MTQRIGFLLLPGFHLLEYAGASDALAAADAVLGGGCYRLLALSADGEPVACSQGRMLPVEAALGDAGELAALFVVACQLPSPGHPLLASLAAALPGIPAICGIGSGAGWLAGTGRLDGRRCTVRWEQVSELAERHPGVVVSTNLYELDGPALSCAGGSASLDMTIRWVGQRHGGRLVRELLGMFGLERLRPGDERQGASRSASVSASGKLTEALALMEANLAEPLATEDVAQLVGVSRRQLERLFKQHLDELPARWYMQQRLGRARRLLQDSSQSILQIGLACGFASGPHFSRAYRAQFGHTPRDERAGRAAAWRAAPANDGEGFAPGPRPPDPTAPDTTRPNEDTFHE